MALFKCKMCGGTLDINEKESIATCTYCNTKQTIPKIDDEKRANLYDRANHFRRNNEFDKAMGIYEQILNEDKTDAEAYWSILLCRYGIEYVEDPSSHKRVPTVNRAQFTSIFDDDNYRSALQYADLYQRSLYEEEAKVINDIQKGILEISQKEEPFDLFICYKESDKNGRRTLDSVLAQELYFQLKQENFKVFFSRITLEDKLGTAYEPYIFAALNSAKVMVVLGTSPEHFNSAWVKNEWSRYLSLIKNGAKKTLIPAYKDMDPYDLPEEFSHLQAQDMSKLGFMQDLIRGIKKIISADAPATQTVVKQTVFTGGNTNIEPLLKRAFMFLEDSDWSSANEYCEKVLDIDPENAQAYLGKLMSELRVNTQSNLKNCAQPFDGNNNYQKAIRFGDDALKKALAEYVEHIRTRNELARLEGVYVRAKRTIESAISEAAFREAAMQFESIGEYKDAAVLSRQCNEKAAFIRKEIEKKAELDRQEKARIAKRNKRIAVITVTVVCVVLAVAIVLNTVIIPNSKYNEAVSLMNSGNIVEVYEKFDDLGDYKDSAQIAASLFEDYKAEKLKSPKVGDYLFFGTYEQDDNTLNGKENIEWLVLDVKDNKALVISKYVLDCREYGFEDDVEDITWKNSSLRKWLNNEFFNTVFSENEKKMIPMVSILTDTNEYEETQDRVFVLSRSEANQYFDSDTARKTEFTEHAYNNGNSNHNGPEGFEPIEDKNSGNWWLRDDDGFFTQTVTSSGDFWSELDWRNYIGVRPAMWIDLTSIEDRYNHAIALLESGDIIEAYKALIALDGYKDSADKANSIYEEYKSEILKAPQVGDYVLLGNYEQDNDISNGKETIEWLVLDVTDDKALLISKHILDYRVYHDSYTNITWEECSIRKWLNSVFINESFTDSEREMIPVVTVSPDKNDSYNTAVGNHTEDSVFLLSISEVESYIEYSNERPSAPTAYAKSKTDGYSSFWWLRTPGGDSYSASYVDDEGYVNRLGVLTYGAGGIRPAMWIELNP